MRVQQLTLTAAAVMLGSVLVSAGTDQSTTKEKGQPSAAAAPNVLTVVGCVEFEQDFRKRMTAGRGGVLGTGAGASDEFVLTNVRPAGGSVGTTGQQRGQARGGTSASAGSGGGVYTLTGTQEKNLKRDVGRQVEIVGTLENAGKPGTGAELTDISDLPRILITAWHPVEDFCPAK